jgi:regulator of sirC expression with transglutaminase-like and TPR domain
MELATALDQLCHNPCAPLDLAEVALELARDEFPNLDVEAYLSQLDAMAHEARRYLRGDLAAQVSGLCRYLFHEVGFRGNVQDYYDPHNSYLNQVLDRCTGIPISLSAVAMAVGSRAGLELQGVGLPGHFVVKAVGAGGEEVFFDPFHGGRRLTPCDCELLVQQVTGRPFEATAGSLSGLPLGFLVQRMLYNLRSVYLCREDFPRAARTLDRLLVLDPDDAALRRDLGTCLLNLCQQGKAIDHLSAYLDAAPDAKDAEEVRRLLRYAQHVIAQWN